jgi:hypothetical protein
MTRLPLTPLPGGGKPADLCSTAERFRWQGDRAASRRFPGSAVRGKSGAPSPENLDPLLVQPVTHQPTLFQVGPVLLSPLGDHPALWDTFLSADALISLRGHQCGVSQRYACLPPRPVVAVARNRERLRHPPYGLPVERSGRAH